MTRNWNYANEAAQSMWFHRWEICSTQFEGGYCTETPYCILHLDPIFYFQKIIFFSFKTFAVCFYKRIRLNLIHLLTFSDRKMVLIMIYRNFRKNDCQLTKMRKCLLLFNNIYHSSLSFTFCFVTLTFYLLLVYSFSTLLYIEIQSTWLVENWFATFGLTLLLKRNRKERKIKQVIIIANPIRRRYGCWMEALHVVMWAYWKLWDSVAMNVDPFFP